jgi:hypothetical protein
MIRFNELRITPDNEYLIIDVSIEDADYYQDVVLDSIIIDTQDTYIENGPSPKAIFKYIVDENNYDLIYSNSDIPTQEEVSEEYCYTKDICSKKHVKLVLNSEDLGIPIEGNMFFVYVLSAGEPSYDTPSEIKENRRIGTVVNLYPIYKQSILYTRELGNNCSIPKNFIDYILKTKALDLSVKTGNYHEAIRYWNKFFKNIRYSGDELFNCECYGKND